jgi:hypothetical protein
MNFLPWNKMIRGVRFEYHRAERKLDLCYSDIFTWCLKIRIIVNITLFSVSQFFSWFVIMSEYWIHERFLRLLAASPHNINIVKTNICISQNTVTNNKSIMLQVSTYYLPSSGLLFWEPFNKSLWLRLGKRPFAFQIR